MKTIFALALSFAPLGILLGAPFVSASLAQPVPAEQTTAPSTTEAKAAAPARTIVVGSPALKGAGAAASDEKIVCKRSLEIGSWVKGTRRCATRSEWRKSEEAARRATQDIQDQKGVYTAP